jgi:hypothetical protein
MPAARHLNRVPRWAPRTRARTAQHEQRLRVGQHADGEDREDPNQVVHFEVVDVLAQPGGGLARGAPSARAHAQAQPPAAWRASAKLSGLA